MLSHVWCRWDSQDCSGYPSNPCSSSSLSNQSFDVIDVTASAAQLMVGDSGALALAATNAAYCSAFSGATTGASSIVPSHVGSGSISGAGCGAGCGAGAGVGPGVGTGITPSA